MWNHLPRMGDAMRQVPIQRPQLTPLELSSLSAFLVTTQYFEPSGDSAKGSRVLVDKGCGQCHAVSGRGGSAGPPLDGLKRSNSPFLLAAALWNHGLLTSAVMKKRGLAPPRLTGPEMADLAAYLYTTSYLDVTREGARRGGELVRQKGCLGCHTIYRRGGKTASDLAIDNVVSTPAGQVAAMWNHARLMEIKGHRQATPLPSLSGSEFAAVTAYLAGLGSGPPKAK